VQRVHTVTATAPVRVCDAGGWTDTWFARHGVVCSIAVQPGAHVSIELGDDAGPTVLDLALTGERYDVSTQARHPLLEAAIATGPPLEGRAAVVRVGAAVPSGSGTGTSAAVVVALLCALHAARGESPGPASLAAEAHRVETGLGLQSGVQDQYAAAYGGCNTIRIDSYPNASVEPVDVSTETVRTLDTRLVTVYVGRPQASSRVHDDVIARLEGDERATNAALQPIRDAAGAAAAALRAGDLDAYGAALTANTRAQESLHPELLSGDARALMDLADRHGAAGWKVNGAGGDGGSVTIVGSDTPAARQALTAEIDRVSRWQRLPFRYSSAGAVAQAAS
jgi:D-glycero-alpha-D-manno-heptose-7-phosphate kinase